VKILVTGGAGYIGSTTARALEVAGHTPVILDSLLSGPRAFTRNRIFYEGDIADHQLLRRVFSDHPDISATIHMAARIVVPESVTDPLTYYRDNVGKSIELFEQLTENGRRRVLYSSSASVYASADDQQEVGESSRLGPTSPYARTKLMTETVLRDLGEAGVLRSIALRYFNPIGSDPDLLSGTYLQRPTHVLGQMLLTAQGEQPVFRLTGTDFATRDGTGIRDYVHVWDLARAHVRAVEQLDAALDRVGAPSTVINIGTGRGVSVRELLRSVEAVTGRELTVELAPARPGDAAGAYANVDRARELLGWRSELGVEEGVRSAWEWLSRRPSMLQG